MRIQVDLPEERVSELQTLMRKLRVDTYKELFTNAVFVLDWMVEETCNGRTIVSIDSNQQQRVPIMPVLHGLGQEYRHTAQ